MSYLLWHETSVSVVSSEDSSHKVAFYDKQEVNRITKYTLWCYNEISLISSCGILGLHCKLYRHVYNCKFLMLLIDNLMFYAIGSISAIIKQFILIPKYELVSSIVYIWKYATCFYKSKQKKICNAWW